MVAEAGASLCDLSAWFCRRLTSEMYKVDYEKLRRQTPASGKRVRAKKNNPSVNGAASSAFLSIGLKDVDVLMCVHVATTPGHLHGGLMLPSACLSQARTTQTHLKYLPVINNGENIHCKKWTE